MMLANSILPLFMPYLMVLMFCTIVLPLETIILHLTQRPGVDPASSIGLVVLANLASWIGGQAITILFSIPQDYIAGPTGPDGSLAIVLAFVAALLLSWLIEYRVILLFSKRYRFRRLKESVFAANLASYLAIIAAMIWIY